KKASVKQLWTAHADLDLLYEYGLGFSMSRHSLKDVFRQNAKSWFPFTVFHGGYVEGSSTKFILMPENHQLAVVLLTNRHLDTHPIIIRIAKIFAKHLNLL